MEENKFLPVGTVVLIKGSVKKIVLIARGVITLIDGEQRYFDYGGCLYPEGLIGDSILYFNHEDIQSVIHKGFSDEDDELMVKHLLKETAKLSIEKGGAE